MMDATDSQDMLDDEKPRTSTVDLSTDSTLVVDISDALSERDRVKFTVHTKTTLPDFKESEFSVVREHEEFVWLHDRLVDNDEYAGIIIPPAPPKPDFDVSREKLQKLGEGENTMTKEEFQKMKQELEAEYLATFKKTVAMHEVFLTRIASHPSLRKDSNFKVFLEYKGELNVRGKNKKEKLGGLFKGLAKGVDEALLSSQKDVDEFFESEKKFLVEYHNKLKDSTRKGDHMTRCHKNCADTFIKISSGVAAMGTSEYAGLDKFLNKSGDYFERARKLEGRVASDEDLKLVDLLRYYLRDTEAAKDLLYRRAKCLSEFEAANKALDKARVKNKEVAAAESAQQHASEKFEQMSEVARQELTDFKTRRVQHFRKNLTELAELELKHAKAHSQLLKNTLAALKEL
ncbi:sorting nexin-6 [Exaiptasia diaphana]|uniref:Sorting nexin n=1 Tax=Exaiptasia diaphana TaxID=2652724 RepID=A0A913WNZ4_EXADI|nr:sorting nexin-6 [Exaiptasia diaphana]KXJ19152.1 Sorting nexin-6 [Exaiptasia diaphana]